MLKFNVLPTIKGVSLISLSALCLTCVTRPKEFNSNSYITDSILKKTLQIIPDGCNTLVLADMSAEPFFSDTYLAIYSADRKLQIAIKIYCRRIDSIVGGNIQFVPMDTKTDQEADNKELSKLGYRLKQIPNFRWVGGSIKESISAFSLDTTSGVLTLQINLHETIIDTATVSKSNVISTSTYTKNLGSFFIDFGRNSLSTFQLNSNIEYELREFIWHDPFVKSSFYRMLSRGDNTAARSWVQMTYYRC